MSNIAVSNDWPAGVYQYADGDVLEGGADSSEVLPIKQLANRSLFQRLANVTEWDSALATEFGYPNKAVVMHEGLSWRAVVANAVEPGTDALKWERWGFTQAEIDQNITTPRVFTVVEREQINMNLTLPVEHLKITQCNSVVVPNTSAYVVQPLTGGTVVSEGDIAVSGNNVLIAKGGLYSISGLYYFLTNGSGICATTAAVFVNGVQEKLLETGTQDKYSSPGPSQGYSGTLSGVVRLAAGDLVSFRTKQEAGGGTSMTNRLWGASLTRVAI